MIEVLDLFNKKIKLSVDISSNDTLKIIKEKIFISFPLDKNFISLNTMALGDGTKYLTSDRDIDLQKTNKLLVYNLTEELKKDIFSNIDIFINISINSKVIDTLYEKIKNIYIGITKDELLLVIYLILSETLDLNISTDRINEWKKKTIEIQTQLIKKYKILDKNISKEMLNKYIFLDKKGDAVYSIINSLISYNISDNKLDLLKIIREYPLDINVPLMILNEYGKSNPIIKIYKKFPKEQVAEWYIKSKKNDNIILKKIKGLTIKLKSINNSYSNVIISKERGKLSIRCNWTKEDGARFDNINTCTLSLDGLVKKINNIFPNLNIKLNSHTSLFINLQFNTRKRILFSKIKLAIQYFKEVLSIDYTLKKKDLVKLIYIPDNITIIIRYADIYINNVIFNSNNIDIIGVNTKKQINTIIEVICKVLIKADNYKNIMTFKNYEFQEVEQTGENIKKIKVNPNIKNLKNEGVSINSTSCQKKRQPVISTKPAVKDSYSITYKGNRFICTNDPFIFPGFTNKNIVCCFKKDQRDKDIYKRNIAFDKNKILSYSENKISDEAIIKTKIIITDKLLENNRLGFLPQTLYKIFDKSFYRLGVFQDRLNLLNVINKALDKTITIEDIVKFIKKNPEKVKTLQDENNTNNIINLTRYVENRYLNHKNIGNILSTIFKTNIIIFNIIENVISCKEVLYLPYKETIFITKNDVNYELIVSKVSDKKLKKVFYKTDNITEEVLNIYKRSCITKYVGFPEKPMNFAELLNNNITILYQVINDFNKVTYVLTKSLGLVPVIPTKPIINIKKTTINKAKMQARDQLKLINKSSIEYIQPTGQIINSKNKTLGIVTKSGLIIPTLASNKLQLPVIYREFIDNIDELLYNEVPSLDKRYTYMLSINFYKELYMRFKYTLSKKINNSSNKDIKDTILLAFNSITDTQELQTILKDTINAVLFDEVIFIDKIEPNVIPSSRNICSELTYENCTMDPFCKQSNNKKCLLYVEKKIYDNFINKLAIEIRSNKNILSNNINKEFVGKNNFIRRKNEIILFTEKEISDFFK